MKFNEKLVFLRKRDGLSQEELADNLGVSRQSISKWELGECEPNISKIQAISQRFSVSFEFLMNDDFDADQARSNELAAGKRAHSVAEPTRIVEVKLILNYWAVLIIIGFVGIVICSIVPYIFGHFYCFTGHSGFLGYVEDWCAGAIVWKIGLIISIVLLIIGIAKTFYKLKT